MPTIGCPECCTFATVDDESKVESHNQSRHGGEDVARIITPDSEDSVNQFVDDARDLAPPSDYKRLIQRIIRGKTPYTVATLNNHD